jgi:ABC-type polysaccharide/polyol phosphate transport system ATPase subunit
MSPDPAGTVDVHRLWKRFRSDPHEGLFGRLRRLGDGGPRWRWALRDVSLRAEAGEAVGVVGVNGSGKSTLLKLLACTMDPTAGRRMVQGPVGSLIELQAGLHPELSGRENAVAYGTLLGLSRRQAREGLDEILDFAGVEDAADRQVKFYSTGMRLRLGFAIAAHLPTPLLLVDEVLAVADADFQRLGLERLQRLHAAGTTVVMVSHDLDSIGRVCDRVVWLDQGRLRADGPAREILDAYVAAHPP